MEDNDKFKDINIGKGAIKMGGHHKKEPIMKTFPSIEEMTEQANDAYGVGKQRENKVEMDEGFDVRSKESVMAFDIGYVPRNAGVVIKEIPKDIVPEEKGITIIELGDEVKRFWIMAVGNVVNDLRKGDIVFVRPELQIVKRRFKKVQFYETDSFGIMGVFTTEEEMQKRLVEHDAKIRAMAKNKPEEEDLEEELEKARQEAREVTRREHEKRKEEVEEIEKKQEKEREKE